MSELSQPYSVNPAMRRIGIQILAAYLAVVGTAVLQAMVTDLEIIAATLLLSLVVLPGLVAYVALRQIYPARTFARHTSYFLLVLPWLASMLYASIGGSESSELAAFLLRIQLAQVLAGYVAVLSMGSWLGGQGCSRHFSLRTILLLVALAAICLATARTLNTLIQDPYWPLTAIVLFWLCLIPIVVQTTRV